MTFNGEDYEFAAGSILGLRSWQMDDDGRLCGVTYHEVWRPGENMSVCKREQRVACPALAKAQAEQVRAGKTERRGLDYLTWAIYDIPESCGEPGCREGTHPAPDTHHFDPNCKCGFWAYDEDHYEPHGDVTGVIEGFGKTTIGTRGFRCEKARIVALCREREDDILSLSKWLRLQQLYPEAKFYDDLDDMVVHHGGVLRTWRTVDEGFWDRKPPSELDSLRDQMKALNASLTRMATRQAYYMPPPTRVWSNGGLLP